MSDARVSGIGKGAAARILRQHLGRWEIAFQEENPAATGFWRRVAFVVTPGAGKEEGRRDPERDFIPPDRWISVNIAV